MQSREYYLKKHFYDNEKFPYGFSRSGDFSIAEAQFLEKHGALYKALFDNKVLDPNESDLKMIKAYQGEIKQLTFEQQTWLKYANFKARSQVWIIPRSKVPHFDDAGTSASLSTGDALDALDALDNIDSLDNIDNLDNLDAPLMDNELGFID